MINIKMDTTEVKNQENLSEEPSVETTSPVMKSSSKRILFLGIIIGVLVCFAAFSGAYFFLKAGKKEVEVPLEKLPTPTAMSQVTPVSTLVWLDKPQEISSIMVFKEKTDLPDEVDY